VWQLVTKYVHHPWLRRAFSVSPLLVGGNPFDTTNIYSLIHYLERKWSIQFAMGGTGALVEALARLMGEVGIKVRLSSTVDKVVIDHGIACGVVLSTGERIAADLVISDADPAFLYSKMIAKPALVPRLKLKYAQSSMGLFVLYFGTTKRYEDVAHHTIWFGDRYRELLQDIFHNHHLGKDFFALCASADGNRSLVRSAGLRLLVRACAGTKPAVGNRLEQCRGRLRRFDSKSVGRNDDARARTACHGALSNDAARLSGSLPERPRRRIFDRTHT